MIRPSDRVSDIQPYYFATKLKEIAELNENGAKVINLGIGSPDLNPPESAVETLKSSLKVNAAHQYQSYYGLPELRQAFIDFYQQHYMTRIESIQNVLPLIGSKEGIMHISMAYLNQGDKVLVPNPGYPAYSACTQLAGGLPLHYNLDGKNNWIPDLDKIKQLDLTDVKLMWINSPHMPSGSVIPKETLSDLISFACEHNILLCHDNPYAFILNDEPQSIMSLRGATDCCLELFSLSKAFNMSGWRIGALIGDPRLLDPIIRFKSNMDSGMFKPMQLAAVSALMSDQSWFDNLNATYRKRKETVHQILDSLRCKYNETQSGLFVWAQHPILTGRELSDKILADAKVFITPGFIFGDQGRASIRISLCNTVEVLNNAHQRILQTL